MGDEDNGGVEPDQILLEPLHRLDVEVVCRLVEQQQLGLRGQCPGQRSAGQLAAGEALQRTVQLGLAEPEPVRRGDRHLAPAVAAGMLETALRLGVGGEGRVRRVAIGHALLQGCQLALDSGDPVEAREDVVAKRGLIRPRRALVVENRARSRAKRERPRVEPQLAHERAKQRRLAAAVAPGQRHALAGVQPERDVAEERARSDVLCEARCRDRGHRCSCVVLGASPRPVAKVRGGSGANAYTEAAACSAASSLTWKDEPQPHAATTLGLFTVNPAPWRPST